MERAAYGKFQLSPYAFYDLTPWEYLQYQEGYQDKVVDLWRIARFQAHVALIAVAGKKAPAPEKLLPLPGDSDRNKEPTIPIPADQFIRMFTNSLGGVIVDEAPKNKPFKPTSIPK